MSKGNSFSLPAGPTTPQAVAFSPDGNYCATANFVTNDVTVFTVSKEGVLSGDTSYPLPSGSLEPYSLSFSPDGLYCATANYGSSDVTVFSVKTGVLSHGRIICVSYRP